MPPKNARPDEPFEVVATLRQSEDGGFSLVAIDGVSISEEEPEEMDDRTDASNIKLPFED